MEEIFWITKCQVDDIEIGFHARNQVEVDRSPPLELRFLKENLQQVMLVLISFRHAWWLDSEVHMRTFPSFVVNFF